MWLPKIVTLADPVAAALLTATLLGADPPYVSAAVSELTCQPVVNATRRPAHTPATALDRIALSDVHTVRAFMLPPNRNGLV